MVVIRAVFFVAVSICISQCSQAFQQGGGPGDPSAPNCYEYSQSKSCVDKCGQMQADSVCNSICFINPMVGIECPSSVYMVENPLFPASYALPRTQVAYAKPGRLLSSFQPVTVCFRKTPCTVCVAGPYSDYCVPDEDLEVQCGLVTYSLAEECP